MQKVCEKAGKGSRRAAQGRRKVAQKPAKRAWKKSTEKRRKREMEVIGPAEGAGPVSSLLADWPLLAFTGRSLTQRKAPRAWAAPYVIAYAHSAGPRL